MKLKIKAGTTSRIIRVYIQDSSSSVGAGLTGLLFNTSGLTAYYSVVGSATATAITLVTATAGTWTSGGFKELDGTNMPGVYELHLPNACLTGGTAVHIVLRGAANMVPVAIEIELDAVDYQDAAAFGLSRIDGTITSRMASYTQPTGFLAATFPTTFPTAVAIRTEIDSNSTQLAKLGSPANTTIAADIAAEAIKTGAIKAKTDNLPSDPADQSLIIDATNSILARLPAALVSGRMDSSVGAMASNTITAAAIATDAGQEIADAVLSRSVATVEGSAAEHSLCTVVLAMLENSISGTTLTIKRTDGSTTHVTKTLSTNADADPITGIT